jgi:photosystem II stability/assembly factor-like uncharacterized protein
VVVLRDQRTLQIHQAMRSITTILFLLIGAGISAVAQWTWTGNTDVAVWGLETNDDRVYAGASGLIHVTDDDGDTWSMIDAPGYVRNILFRDEMIFITTSFQGVYRSMDDGASWQAINEGIDEPAQAWSLAQNDSLLILGTSGSFAGDIAAIYISSDNGSTWTQVFSLGMYDVFYSFSTHEDEVYVGVLPSGVYYSGDKGVTWELRNSMLPAKFISYTEDHLLCAITGATGGIYRSTNGALSWELVLPLYYGNAFAASDGRTFAGTSNGVYYSLDAGITWQTYNEGMPPLTEVTSISIAEPWIFAGTSSGDIHRRNMSDIITGSQAESTETMLSIFPNPISDSFTITGPALIGPCTVRIHDAIGRCVHQAIFNAEKILHVDPLDLKDGLYHVEVMNGSDRYTRQVIVRGNR